MDVWNVLVGLLAVLLILGVAVILWAVISSRRKRGQGPQRPSWREPQYDEEGYDPRGYDREGYDRLGYDTRGYDRNGYDWQGYNTQGYNRQGYDRFGYDRQGYNADGYDRQGYTAHGRDARGRYNRLHDVAEFAQSLYSEEGFLNPQRYPVGMTDHAQQRIRERMVCRGKAPRELALEAYSYGKSARQLKRTSARLVQEIQEEHEDSVVLIYHGYIYIFSSDNQLITVYRNERIPL